MFPNVRSSRLTVQASNSTSWAIAFPQSGDIKDGGSDIVKSGDIILVVIGRDGTGTTHSITGYTEKYFNSQSAANSLIVYAKVADGTETSIPNFSTNTEQGVARVIIVKDTNSGSLNDIEVGGTEFNTGTSTSPNPLSFSPSWGLTDTRWTAIMSNDGSPTVTAYPSGFTDNPNADSSGGSTGASLGSASKNERTATMDATAFTISAAENWIAAVIAIRGNDLNIITETNAITDTVSASITQSRYPVPLGTFQKGTTASGTSHVVTLPSGIQAGELLLIICGAKNVAFNTITNNQWKAQSTGIGVGASAIYYKIADGTESGANVTVPTGAAAAVAWVTMRVGDPNGIKKPQLLSWRRGGYTASTSMNPTGWNLGNTSGDFFILLAFGTSGTNTVTQNSTGYSTVDAVVGATNEGGVHIQGAGFNLSAWGSIDPDAVTFSGSTDGYLHGIIVKYYDDGFAQEPMQGSNGRTTTLQQWFSQKSLTDTNFGRGQSFKASGGAIKKVIAHVMKSNVAQTTGTVVCKIYAHSGTFGSSSVPTGSALATSDSVNINDLFVPPNTFGYDVAIEFTFATAFQTTNNTNYVVTIEISGNGDTNPVYVVDGYTSADEGNPCFYTGGAWTSETGEAQFELIKEVSSVATIAETNAITDTPSATNTTSASQAETNAIAETNTATNATSASQSETNAIAETITASKSTSGAIAETNAIAETTDATIAKGGTIAETNAIAETVNSTNATSSAQSETNAIAETITATVTTSASIAETNAISESTDGTKVNLGDVSESNAIAETTNATINRAGAIAESNAIAETVNSTNATSASQNETNAIAETVTGLRTTPATQSETNAIAETVNATNATSSAMSESAGIAETITATVQTSAAIVETNTIAETTEGSTGAMVLETNAIAESVDATKATSSAIAETNAITDDVQATWQTSAAITESNAILETIETSFNRLVVMSESAGIAETIDATIQTSAQIAESSSISEMTEGSTGAIMLETSAINDTPNATLQTSAQRQEQASIVESVDSVKVTATSNVESAVISDLISANVNRNATILETGTIADVLSAVNTTYAQQYESISILELVDFLTPIFDKQFSKKSQIFPNLINRSEIVEVDENNDIEETYKRTSNDL